MKTFEEIELKREGEKQEVVTSDDYIISQMKEFEKKRSQREVIWSLVAIVVMVGLIILKNIIDGKGK